MTAAETARHASADLALAVYLEPLLEERRVLVVGAVLELVAERLRVAASEVEVVERVADARGSYDVVLCPDADAQGAPLRELLQTLVALTGTGGCAIVGARATSAAAFDALRDAALERGGMLRMLGQAPLRGFALVDFEASSDDAPDVTFDQSLLGDAPEPAHRYIAVLGVGPGDLDAYGVIQVPGPDARMDAERTLASRTRALADLDGEVERLKLELDALRAESDTRGAALHDARRELERLRLRARGRER